MRRAFTERVSRRILLKAGAGLVVPGFLGRRSALREGGSRAGYVAGQRAAAQISTIDLGGARLLQGAGCNVVAVPGPDGALMIDGGRVANAEALLAAVKSTTGSSRVHTLINTHWHPEQTGANELVGRSGGAILAHEKTALSLSNTNYSSATFTGRLAPLAQAARPTKTVRGDGSLEFAGRQIDYGYMPAAHTDGDLYIHAPSLNVLVVGGVVSAEGWPLLDYRNGAWLGGRVRALQRLAGLVKPDTRVVPADGRLMTGSEIVRHRDMYQKLFTTMIGYLNMGLGPEDAVVRNPLKEYQGEFGDPSAFTYGALRSMMIAYVPD
ncbi:MAG TPA: MBL fold metallo-hydrolase [Vicinamibacterales bacterium]|nr:MBL fold metallo-hydrolase [Vicinamibacterales bacterium]